MTSITDSHVSVSLVSCAHGGVIPWCPLDIINHWLWDRNWANNVPSRQELVSRLRAIKIITHLTIGDRTQSRVRDTWGNVTMIRLALNASRQLCAMWTNKILGIRNSIHSISDCVPVKCPTWKQEKWGKCLFGFTITSSFLERSTNPKRVLLGLAAIAKKLNKNSFLLLQVWMQQSRVFQSKYVSAWEVFLPLLARQLPELCQQ